MAIAHGNPKSKINKHSCSLMQLSGHQQRDTGWELQPWKKVGTMEQGIALARWECLYLWLWWLKPEGKCIGQGKAKVKSDIHIQSQLSKLGPLKWVSEPTCAVRQSQWSGTDECITDGQPKDRWLQRAGQEVNDGKDFRRLGRVRRIKGMLILTVGLLFIPRADVRRKSTCIKMSRAHLQ